MIDRLGNRLRTALDRSATAVERPATGVGGSIAVHRPFTRSPEPDWIAAPPRDPVPVVLDAVVPEPVAEDPVDPDVDESADHGADVEFIAYGEDCVLSGHLSLAGERLSDVLNAQEEYLLADVFVTSLDGTEVVEVNEVVVPREELVLVQVAGPRGSRRRRHRTRMHRVALQVGPYRVRGYLHALPGLDPIATIKRGRPMVPLTEATIEFFAGEDREERPVGSVVVNRDRIDWAAPATDDAIDLPDLPVALATGRMVKDFTGVMFEEAVGADPG